MSEHAFLEGHYYSGGLRYHAYVAGTRPSWAPPADSVGFRDEFELEEGASAIELRRFRFNGAVVSFVGVFYRSIDAKFGDRGNHAGMGAWFRDVIPFDFNGLLAGLEQLAERIAEDIDPQALVSGAAEFSSDEFLPHYAIGQPVEPSPAFAFGDTGIVDFKIYHVACAGRPSQCAALTDFLLRVSLLHGDPLPPRLLIHAGSKDITTSQKTTDISLSLSAAPALVRQLPTLLSAERRRAEHAERDLAELRSRAEQIQEEHLRLTRDNSELEQFRNDPMHSIDQRLADIKNDIRTLLSKASAPQVLTPTYQLPPVGGGRRKPVSVAPRSEVPEASFDYAWLWPFIFIAVGVGILGALLMIAWPHIVGLFGGAVG